MQLLKLYAGKMIVTVKVKAWIIHYGAVLPVEMKTAQFTCVHDTQKVRLFS